MTRNASLSVHFGPCRGGYAQHSSIDVSILSQSSPGMVLEYLGLGVGTSLWIFQCSRSFRDRVRIDKAEQIEESTERAMVANP